MIPPGHYFQIYVGGCPHGLDFGPVIQGCRAHGATGLVWHGPPDAWLSRLLDATLANMLVAGVAYGEDGTLTDSATKGRRAGNVFADHRVTFGDVDCEGRWDKSNRNPPPYADPIPFIAGIREKCPDKAVLTQQWPVPTVHSGFPFQAFLKAGFKDFPQYYFNDWKGAHRYSRLRPLFDKAHVRMGLPVPDCVTLQADGWEDCPADFVDALLYYPTALLWCDHGVPGKLALECVAAVARLRREGVTVSQWQAAHGLTVDGRCGDKTRASLLAP